MTIDTLATILALGGVLHFGILVASALTPGALDWKSELRTLPPMLRKLIWVHGAFIVLVIVAFGLISLLHARDLAGGTALARAVCGGLVTATAMTLFIVPILYTLLIRERKHPHTEPELEPAPQ